MRIALSSTEMPRGSSRDDPICQVVRYASAKELARQRVRSRSPQEDAPCGVSPFLRADAMIQHCRAGGDRPDRRIGVRFRRPHPHDPQPVGNPRRRSDQSERNLLRRLRIGLDTLPKRRDEAIDWAFQRPGLRLRVVWLLCQLR